jgi:hypothetical protein
VTGRTTTWWSRARVEGQPRIVDQQYLGTAEEVLGRLASTASGAPQRSQHRAFGDVAAVWCQPSRNSLAGASRNSLLARGRLFYRMRAGVARSGGSMTSRIWAAR